MGRVVWHRVDLPVHQAACAIPVRSSKYLSHLPPSHELPIPVPGSSHILFTTSLIPISTPMSIPTPVHPPFNSGCFTMTWEGNTCILQEDTPEKKTWATATINNHEITFKNESGNEYAKLIGGIIYYPNDPACSTSGQPVNEWLKVDPSGGRTWYDRFSLTLIFCV